MENFRKHSGQKTVSLLLMESVGGNIATAMPHLHQLLILSPSGGSSCFVLSFRGRVLFRRFAISSP